MRRFSAGENEEGVRLSRFVAQVTQNLPNSLLYKSFRNGRIKVNGKKAGADTRLITGDIIELYINDEFFPAKPAAQGPAISSGRPALPLATVWQNKDIAILYKPAGLLCHNDNTKDPTLQAIFADTLAGHGEYSPSSENTFAPALCNRLDRGTEGLVIGAKRYAALRDMNELIRLGLVQKTYLCVAVGTPPEGVFNAFLQRDKNAKKGTVSSHSAPGAKPISTGVKVLKQHDGLALCEIDLLTGRTHQIRAHLAYLGAPILGDLKYGNPAINQAYKQKTQLLCAYRLSFAQNLPPASTLAYLSGKHFTAENSYTLCWWQNFA